MATVNEIFLKSLALIDELLPSGERDPGKTEDYAGKAPKIVDMVQKELLKSGDFYSKYEISRSPVSNMLGFISGFEMQEYKGIDLMFQCNNDQYGGVKAYCFETDSNTGTAYIEDYNGSWNVLATIPMSNTGIGFAQYKGSVTPSPGASMSRIRFSGPNYYRIVNRALFNMSFESGKEPTYAPWVQIQLPANLKTIEQVITEYPERQYGKDPVYKIEWSGTRQSLYVNYYYVGKIRVQYKPVPAAVTALTDSLELDDITCQLIAYELAKNFMAAEQNEYLTKILGDKYNQLKAESFIKQPMGTSEIIDFYAGW